MPGVNFFLLVVSWLGAVRTQITADRELITSDANAASRPSRISGKTVCGSGRTTLSLRESYRRDLYEVRRSTDPKCVRFSTLTTPKCGVVFAFSPQ